MTSSRIMTGSSSTWWSTTAEARGVTRRGQEVGSIRRFQKSADYIRLWNGMINWLWFLKLAFCKENFISNKQTSYPNARRHVPKMSIERTTVTLSISSGQGEAQCLVWACRACKRMRRVLDRWVLQCCMLQCHSDILSSPGEPWPPCGRGSVWGRWRYSAAFSLHFTLHRPCRWTKLSRSSGSTPALPQTTDFRRHL